MRPPLNGATPEKPVGFGFYYMTRTLEAGRPLSCPPTSTREDTYSAVFGRIPLYSLSSSPLYSRGALNTLHSAVLPPRAYSARRLVRRTAAATPHTGLNPHWIRYSGGMVHAGSRPTRSCSPSSKSSSTRRSTSAPWTTSAPRPSSCTRRPPPTHDTSSTLSSVSYVACPSLLLVQKAMLKRVARPWWDLSVKMKHDSDANHIFGWVLRDVGLQPPSLTTDDE